MKTSGKQLIRKLLHRSISLSLLVALSQADQGWARSPNAIVTGTSHRVETFVDVFDSNQRLQQDIRKASDRANTDAEIWIAMWSWSDDFLLDTNNQTLVGELKAALLRNPNLKIYTLLWSMPAGTKLLVNLGWQPFKESAMVSDLPESARKRFILARQSLLFWHPLSSAHQKFVLMKFGGESVGYCFDYNFQNFHFDWSDHNAGRRVADKFKLPPVHDTAIRFQGKAISTLQQEFLQRWERSGSHSTLPQGSFPIKAEESTLPNLKALFHEPGIKGGGIQRWYIDAIRRAKEHIYLESQYFDDPDVGDALINAYFRKLNEPQPNIIFNLCSSKTVEPRNQVDGNLREVMRVRLTTADEIELTDGEVIKRKGMWRRVKVNKSATECYLKGRGAKSRKIPLKDIKQTRGGVRFITMVTATTEADAKSGIQPIYIHSKVGLIDNQLTIGSANQNKRSARQDYEANVMLTDSRSTHESENFQKRLLEALVAPGAVGDTLLQKVDYTASQNSIHNNADQTTKPVGLVIEYPYQK